MRSIIMLTLRIKIRIGSDWIGLHADWSVGFVGLIDGRRPELKNTPKSNGHHTRSPRHKQLNCTTPHTPPPLPPCRGFNEFYFLSNHLAATWDRAGTDLGGATQCKGLFLLGCQQAMHVLLSFCNTWATSLNIPIAPTIIWRHKQDLIVPPTIFYLRILCSTIYSLI